MEMKLGVERLIYWMAHSRPMKGLIETATTLDPHDVEIAMGEIHVSGGEQDAFLERVKVGAHNTLRLWPLRPPWQWP